MDAMRFSPAQRLHHAVIRSRWRRWLAPSLCAVPYCVSLVWLVHQGQIWIVQIMLTPLLMMAVLGWLTWWLARLEFQLQRRGGHGFGKIQAFLKADVRRTLRSLVPR